jgi:hypothetical protein
VKPETERNINWHHTGHHGGSSPSFRRSETTVKPSRRVVGEAPQLDFYMNLLKYSSKCSSLMCKKFKTIHKIILQEMVFFINKVHKTMFFPQIDVKVGVRIS